MDTQSDVTSTIMNTINTIFDSLFSSINTNLYSTLDDITFISSDILYDSNFENIFGTSTTNGILLIANSLLIGFLIYFSSKKLFSYITYSEVESSSSFIFKLILFAIFMNFSFFTIEIVLDLNSNISLAIRSLGETLFNKNICFSELISDINSNITDSSITSTDTTDINIFSLDGLIEGAITLSMLNLVLSYSLRYIMVKVFIILAPFAFLSLCLNSTSWFFKSWAKNLFSLLFIQIIVSIVLLILFSMDYSDSDLFVKFIYIGGIYALIKANSFVREFIGGVSTTVSQNITNISNL